MNVERINQLADDLDKVQAVNSTQFSMSYWGYHMFRDIGAFDSNETPTISTDDLIEQCETAGCLAGWATLLYGTPNDSMHPNGFAERHLELNENEAHDLFTPEEHDEDDSDDNNANRVIYAQINAGMAAKVLRHLANTGDVDWNQAYS